MKRKWKILIVLVAVAIAGAGVYASTVYSKRGIVTVQTGKVVKQDFTSIVTASGAIKPKNYINIGANAFGVITDLLVKEGDRVRKGQLMLQLDDAQYRSSSQQAQAAVATARARLSEDRKSVV